MPMASGGILRIWLQANPRRAPRATSTIRVSEVAALQMMFVALPMQTCKQYHYPYFALRGKKFQSLASSFELLSSASELFPLKLHLEE
jgi:hypothetical protein